MDMRAFDTILVALAFSGAFALWAYAYALAGPAGRNRLLGGLPHLIHPHRGRHSAGVVAGDERPTYDGETVHLGNLPDELARIAAYEQMRAEGLTEVIPISSQPLVAFTQDLAPNDLDELRAMLDDIERDVLNTFRVRVDEALAAFTADRTGEFATVS